MRFHSYTYRREAMNSRSLCLALPGSVWVSGHMQTSEQLWLQYRPARNSRRFSRLFREKPEFYGENPIAKRFEMGFSQATVHALDRACTVASYEQLYHILENYYNTSFLFVI